MDFAPAALLGGCTVEDRGCEQLVFVPSPSFVERFEKLPLSATVTARVDGPPLRRMLAKISHSFLVGMVGLDSVAPFLPPYILGEKAAIHIFVGGALRRRRSNMLHSCKAYRSLGMWLVDVTLFARLGGPTYTIVVGRALQ
jgi:hypothetical protein